MAAPVLDLESPAALDLGSGPEPAAGFVGVDLCDAPNVVVADLWSGEPWPFPDRSVSRLRASHVIEHIPHARIVVGTTRVRRTSRSPGRGAIVTHSSIEVTADAFFWFFDEAFRVAAPGCRFELAWPHPLSDGADQDPSHCRRVPVSALHYLSREGRLAMRVQHYPVSCDWQIEPGSVQVLGTDESLAPFAGDLAEACRHHGAFHEIRCVLVKP